MGNVVQVQKITLRSARYNRRLSIQEAADRVGVSTGTLEEYERDSRQIPFDDAMKLFKVYGVSSVNVFIGVDDIE
jgi:transcriptional regulator with XRE-family HTH domain